MNIAVVVGLVQALAFVQSSPEPGSSQPGSADPDPQASQAASEVSTRPSESAEQVVPFPDVGRVRYRDPSRAREIWLGADVGGAVLPASLGRFDRTVWTVHGTPAWALALTPWLTVGGRHTVIVYDAVNIRLREHDHTVELSARTLALRSKPRRFSDRLAVGVSTHAIKKSTVDGLVIKPGGLNDTIVHVSYGLSHAIGRRVRLGWQVAARHAWVFRSTQRQVRAAMRGSVLLGQRHRLALEGIGYYVHRDAEQAGNPLPRNGVYAQAAAQWVWMSKHGVGPMVRARFLSSFRSGEAPAYEIREEALNTSYGELIVGLRAVWR